jgi:hypothetical protein
MLPVQAREGVLQCVEGKEQEHREAAVPAQAHAAGVALLAAWYVVPVEAVDIRLLEFPGVVVDTAAAGVALMLDSPAKVVDVVAVDLQQVAAGAEFLNHAHNMNSRFLVLNCDHNMGNAWFALPSVFLMMIVLALVYHNVIRAVFIKREQELVLEYRYS